MEELLNCHPDLHCDGELMNPNYRHVGHPWPRRLYWFFPWPLFRYRRFLNRKNKVYGFTLFPYHIRKVERRVQQLYRAGWKIIYVRRRNLLNQAFSNIIARNTDRWHRRKDSTGDAPFPRITITPEELLHEIMVFVSWRDREGKALQGIPHLEVVYEDMLECEGCWSGTMEKVFGFLGVDVVPVRSSLIKTYPRPYSEIVSNHDELMEVVKRSRYAYLLEQKEPDHGLANPDGDRPAVLLTGASGYVGSSLWGLLQDDFRFAGLSRRPVGDMISYAELDHLPPVDAVIHLAGMAHDVSGYASEQTYREANVDLTRRIFDDFLRSEARTFIFFSSVLAAADELPHGAVLTEAHPARPQSVYGRSKREAEEYLLQPLTEHPDKRVIILRPAMIYGPGNKGNMNLLVDLVKRRWPWPLGAFDNRRSFASIQNVAFAVKGILTGPVPSGIYHLADDEALSTNELVRLIAKSLGHKPWIWKLPRPLIRLAARLGDFLPLPLNSQRLRKLTGSFVVSNDKLKAALETEHMPASIRQAMLQTLELAPSDEKP